MESFTATSDSTSAVKDNFNTNNADNSEAITTFPPVNFYSTKKLPELNNLSFLDVSASESNADCHDETLSESFIYTGIEDSLQLIDSEISVRPKRSVKKKYLQELNSSDVEVSESDEEYVSINSIQKSKRCKLEINEASSSKIIPENNEINVINIPKKKAGRPKGSKNKYPSIKKKNGKEKKNPIKKIVRNVDDSENDPNKNPPPQEKISDHDSIPGETGCNDPVKQCKKTRIRTRNTNEWQKNVQKNARNAGEPYMSKTKDKKKLQKPAAKIGPACNCKNKCYDLLGDEAVKAIHKDFYDLPSYDLKTTDLQRKISRAPTKNQELLGENNTRRVKGIYTLHVFYKEKSFQICKTAFLNIHAIGKDRLYIADEKRTETGATIPDQRGKGGHHNKLPEEQVQFVHEHITSLPVRSSHYTRTENPNRQYIDLPDKESVRWIHTRYIEWLKREKGRAKEPVKLSYYRYIYNNFYNIESSKPRTDICEKCYKLGEQIKLDKANSKDVTVLEEELKMHKAKAQVAYKHLKEGKNGDLWNPEEWEVICMDLQQTHMIPKTAVGSAYYKRKLNVYNFCITELQTKEPYFYMWEEFNGRKGSSEIYSCLIKWLTEHIFIKNNRPKKLRIIADNCGGQNKNNNLVLALLRLVHLEQFNRIELAFLVPGHSFMPCDQQFGVIQRKLNTFQEIDSPDTLVTYIKGARINTTKGERNHKGKISKTTKGDLKVYNLKREEIVNINVFTDKSYDRVALIRPTEGKVFQTASIIVVKATYRNGYILKKNFEDPDDHGIQIDVSLPNATEEYNLSNIVLGQKYPCEIKLNPQKLTDLVSMRDQLGESGDWIDNLVNSQQNIEGPYDEVINDDDSSIGGCHYEQDLVKRKDDVIIDDYSSDGGCSAETDDV